MKTKADDLRDAVAAVRDAHNLFEGYDGLATENEEWRWEEIPDATPCPTENFETIQPIRDQERAVSVIRAEVRKRFRKAIAALDAAFAGGVVNGRN